MHAFGPGHKIMLYQFKLFSMQRNKNKGEFVDLVV